MFCCIHHLLVLSTCFLVWLDNANSVRYDDVNACTRYTMRRKANGQYDKVLEMRCCPNYMEKDNLCEPCPPGLFGQNCTVPCLTNKWGSQCKETCDCVSEKTCDPRIGCVCRAGLYGEQCDKVCANGKYGVNCQYDCRCSENGNCDATDGSCTCNPGWTGSTCHEQCPYPYYGENCGSRCNCSHEQSCHPVTGDCICPAGYIGDDCNTACRDGKYGINCEGTCGCRNGVCDTTNGSCTCSAGFTGKYCDEDCPAGRFGEGCRQACTCQKTQSCDPVTGECVCPPGYQGTQCNQNCDRNFYGPGCRKRCQCSDTGTCDQFDGSCDCDRGWTGSTCTEKCSKDFYGKQCHYQCTCPVFKECDHVTGDCHCPSGSKGSRCSQECSPGTFGIDCKETCLCNNCNAVSGSCVESHEDKSSYMTVYYIVGSCVGAIVIGVVMCFVVVRLRHIRGRKDAKSSPKREDGSNVYDDVDDYAEISTSKMLVDFPYSYADSTDIKPQIKPRDQSIKKPENKYMSINEIEEINRKSAQIGRKSDTYTGLKTPEGTQGENRNYEALTLDRRARLCSSESQESKSGYLKATDLSKQSECRNDRYTVDCGEISNPDYMSQEDIHSDGSSTDSSTGYLKPINSMKVKNRNRDMLHHKQEPNEEETDSVNSTSSESGYLVSQTTTSHQNDTEIDDYDRPVNTGDYERPITRQPQVSSSGPCNSEETDYDHPKSSLDKDKHELLGDSCVETSDYDIPKSVPTVDYDVPPNTHNQQQKEEMDNLDETNVNVNYDTPKSLENAIKSRERSRKIKTKAKQRKKIDYDFPSNAALQKKKGESPKPEVDTQDDCPNDYDIPNTAVNETLMCYDTPRSLRKNVPSELEKRMVTNAKTEHENVDPDYLLPVVSGSSPYDTPNGIQSSKEEQNSRRPPTIQPKPSKKSKESTDVYHYINQNGEISSVQSISGNVKPSENDVYDHLDRTQ